MIPRDRLYPTVAEIEAEKAFAKRINFEVGWATCNPKVRNPKPTEEEKRMFIQRYGAKRKSQEKDESEGRDS